MQALKSPDNLKKLYSIPWSVNQIGKLTPNLSQVDLKPLLTKTSNLNWLKTKKNNLKNIKLELQTKTKTEISIWILKLVSKAIHYAKL